MSFVWHYLYKSVRLDKWCSAANCFLELVCSAEWMTTPYRVKPATLPYTCNIRSASVPLQHHIGLNYILFIFCLRTYHLIKYCRYIIFKTVTWENAVAWAKCTSYKKILLRENAFVPPFRLALQTVSDSYYCTTDQLIKCNIANYIFL